ncbi:adenylate/guanylate cyclase domain-containing protein [Mucilaginibacter lutimaris]|uniref:Adenylate/guanylate cyclase domain-containing protein n=1 Tax=Mucilaginibacter lutimaris TaxID=931629 RepID=A0ABW2ZCH4_9SPHI
MENTYLSLNTCPAINNSSPDEERELAILFLDIRNFTGLMESQPQQSVITVVRRLFTAFNQIVKSLQGKVVEIAGDNLYAVFGLQTSLTEAVNNAYQAAKTMFHTVNLFNEAYAVPFHGGPLQIGVGLHAGRVFVGEFGLDAPAELSVMGLSVNIAARLQAKTKELNNDMLISEYAYSMINTIGTSPDKQTVQLQGIAQNQQIRLAGKPYDNSRQLASNALSMDYLLAISG